MSAPPESSRLHRNPAIEEPEAPSAAITGGHRCDSLAVPFERLMIATRVVDATAVPFIGPRATVIMAVALRCTRTVAAGARLGAGRAHAKPQ